MILIIGKGFVGRELELELLSRHIPYHLVSHNEDWVSLAYSNKPTLIVNAAAIAGQQKCKVAGEKVVMKANVAFAQEVVAVANSIGVPSVLFSTAGVYMNPHSIPKAETDPTAQRNLYVDSKLRMEETCRGDAIIFRIPSVSGSLRDDRDYLNRLKTWQWVQDCYMNLLAMGLLTDTICFLATADCENGIYNLANSKILHLPTYAKLNGFSVEVRKQIPSDFTQCHILHTEKARVAGLLRC